MRRVLKRKDNVIGFKFENLSFQNVVVREKSLVDSFYFEETVSSDDNKKCIAFTDPIRMIFNEQRLKSVGTGAVAAWIDSLKNFKVDPLAEIRSKCSDEELKQMIKSRMIQQPSEIMAWAKQCTENLDQFNNELSEAAKILQQQQADEALKKAESGKPVESNVEPVSVE